MKQANSREAALAAVASKNANAKAAESAQLPRATYNDLLIVFRDPHFQAEVAFQYFVFLSARLFCENNVLRKINDLRLLRVQPLTQKHLRDVNLPRTMREIVNRFIAQLNLSLPFDVSSKIADVMVQRMDLDTAYRDFVVMAEDATLLVQASKRPSRFFYTLCNTALKPDAMSGVSQLSISSIVHNEAQILFGDSREYYVKSTAELMERHEARGHQFSVRTHIGLNGLSNALLLMMHSLPLFILSPLMSIAYRGAANIFDLECVETQVALLVVTLIVACYRSGTQLFSLFSLAIVLGSSKLDISLAGLQQIGVEQLTDCLITSIIMSFVSPFINDILITRSIDELRSEPCEGFLQQMRLQALNPARLEKLFGSSSKVMSPAQLDPSAITQAVVRTSAVVRRSRATAVVTSECKEVGQHRKADSEQDLQITFDGKSYKQDPVYPQIYRCLDENDKTYLTRLRNANGQFTREFVLHNTDLLRSACQLDDRQLSRLTRSVQYQNGLFASRRMGENGFIRSAGPAEPFKFKLFAHASSGGVAGKWPTYTPTNCEGSTVYVPHGVYNHR